MLGHKYNRLTPVEFLGSDGRGHGLWKCVCDCGSANVIAVTARLRNGYKKSCGCLQREVRSTSHFKHGHAATISREYNIWSGIKSRCLNPSALYFHRYGGRGISICSRWRESFSSFLEDMGRAPSDQHSIDRINNDGNYDPSNCRWATRKQQGRNTRKNRIVAINGKDMVFSEACEVYGIHWATAISRIKSGWSPEKAFMTPPNQLRLPKHKRTKDVICQGR